MVEDKENPYLLLFKPEAAYETSAASRDASFQNYVSQTTPAGTPHTNPLLEPNERDGDPYYEVFSKLPDEILQEQERYLSQVTSIPGTSPSE
jgi:hypothetical protein